MRKTFSKILICIVSIALLLSFAPAVFADSNDGLYNYVNEKDWPKAPNINSEGAFLINADTGTVLFGKNENTKLYPASITKVLTALVVIEEVGDLKEELTFSHNAINDLESGGFSYIAKEGDELTVYDALHALLLKSSNECAYALAEHVSGSLEAFAKLMNEKAEELGAVNSHFVNPHGLTNNDHYTCPHDMAIILRAAANNETFLAIDSKTTYKTAPTSNYPQGFPCEMGHKMLVKDSGYYDSRVICGKTGFITAAKNTLVTCAKSNNVKLVCVVMKADGYDTAYKDTKALLDYGYNNFAYQKISTSVNETTIKSEITQGHPDYIESLAFSQDVQIYYPKNKTPNITYEVSFNKNKSETEGKVVYKIGDQKVAETNLTIKYAHGEFVRFLMKIFLNDDGNLAWYTYFIIIFVVSTLTLVIYIIVIKKRDNKRIKNHIRATSRKRPID